MGSVQIDEVRIKSVDEKNRVEYLLDECKRADLRVRMQSGSNDKQLQSWTYKFELLVFRSEREGHSRTLYRFFIIIHHSTT